MLATVALVGAVLTGYAQRTVLDADQFANRATVALESDSVRPLVAERVTDAVLAAEADLLAARPAIEAAAEGIVGGGAFTKLFRAGVRDLHRALVNGDRDTVSLTLVDVGTVLSGALHAFAPKTAATVEKRAGRVELLEREIGDVTADLTRAVEDIRALAILLFVATAGLFAAAVATSTDRRRTIGHAGAWIAGAGVLVVLAYAVLRGAALAGVDDPAERAGAGAVWDAFLGDLRTAAWIVAGSGAIVAAAAASLITPIDVETRVARLWRAIAAEPRGPALRVIRALGLILAGIVILTQRDAVLHLAVTLAGVYALYKGSESILRMIAKPQPEAAAGTRGARTAAREQRLRAVPHRTVLVGALSVLAVAVAVSVFVGTGGTSEAAPPITRCNGRAELCDRRLDQVAMPATHNSMSAPLPGFFAAEQEKPIRGQLDDGIRGLLIDTHYGVKLPNGRVRTDLEDTENVERSKYEDELGPKAIEAALRIRKRLGFAGRGERGMYLCHTFCELGATPLAPVLDDIRDFLVSNPHEVVVIVNQDAITPADFVKAADRAGLSRFAYRGPPAGPYPTLRELIERDQRLMVMAEARAGVAPWYRLAYRRITQETPFDFRSAGKLTGERPLPETCAPNRGPAGAPLFLINHWVSTDPTPFPSDASKVNARGPLMRRATQCRRQRGRVPNLLAVNFYRRGDVFEVVDELNRLAPEGDSD